MCFDSDTFHSSDVFMYIDTIIRNRLVSSESKIFLPPFFFFFFSLSMVKLIANARWVSHVESLPFCFANWNVIYNVVSLNRSRWTSPKRFIYDVTWPRLCWQIRFVLARRLETLDIKINRIFIFSFNIICRLIKIVSYKFLSFFFKSDLFFF